ncbi:hypothetical protein DPSP01_013325 [Paraphaeosphaeria sporulosa]|uniref:Uncharacterized protein n=1 Tax=Paraphaeosphaeria sporulosa TaxID=1460663 RepID=A0A177D1P1_9PLEO|nr:uncharacterized protein CC84DRAFT_1212546 [Paraphaeosphaeria sporulosa]OAG13092.1 hypothetical protein CC84DRAFT_1212546 [Paraphaeosphaeria sporulosa]
MTENIKNAGCFLKPPLDSAESRFTYSPAWQDLARWGYQYCDATTLDEWYGEFRLNWGINKALQSNELSEVDIRSAPPTRVRDQLNQEDVVCDDGHWRDVEELGEDQNAVFYVAHCNMNKRFSSPCEQSYVVDGKRYMYTGASCAVSIDPDQGVIISTDRMSPTHMVKCHDGLMAPPDLVHTSDIMFALWKDIAGADRIANFLSICIDNDISEHVIKEVMQGNMQSYPGLMFSTKDPEGQALLGTPTAVAIGYLLAQHTGAMGVRYVDSVRVFKSDSQSRSPCLMFYIFSDDDGQSEDEEEQEKKKMQLL